MDFLKEAMDFKIKNKKISVLDAIGYILSKKFKVKFLTGDQDFKNLFNVEYVK